MYLFPCHQWWEAHTLWTRRGGGKETKQKVLVTLISSFLLRFEAKMPFENREKVDETFVRLYAALPSCQMEDEHLCIINSIFHLSSLGLPLGRCERRSSTIGKEIVFRRMKCKEKYEEASRLFAMLAIEVWCVSSSRLIFIFLSFYPLLFLSPIFFTNTILPPSSSRCQSAFWLPLTVSDSLFPVWTKWSTASFDRNVIRASAS